MKNYIQSLEDEDVDKFVIVKSKLLYVGTDKKELEIANRLGIGGGVEGSDAGATVKEIQSIVDGVVELKDSFGGQLPANDTDKLDSLENTDSSKGIIGTRLFDRSDLNLVNGTWNILIEYDRENKETARYGTGYYWLKKDNEYTIGDETLNFKNDYVIDYKNKEFIVLSGRAVNWNVDATLGVSGAVFNLDPMSLANGEWQEGDDIDEVNNGKFQNFIVKNTDGTEVNTGIQKVGDVVYDKTNNSLNINKDSVNNPDGQTGYLRYNSGDLDFTNGFTFEFYGNFDEIYRKNVTGGGGGFALFTKTTSLRRQGYSRAFRCGCSGAGDKMWFAVYDISRDTFNTELFGTRGGRLYATAEEKRGFKENEDAYVTYVWQIYNPEESKRYKEENTELYNSKQGNFDEEMDDYYNNDEKVIDKILYYVNSELIGYGYFNHLDLIDGTRYWGGTDAKFYVGACNFWGDGQIYLMKGKCYTTRMYTKSMTPEQVKLNYDMTLKYRNSF